LVNKQLNSTANNLKKGYLQYILHVEDTILQLYRYIDFDLTPQIKKGSPLYEHFMLVNPEHSSEPNSKVEMGVSDKHVSGVIEVLSGASTMDPTGYALIILTR